MQSLLLQIILSCLLIGAAHAEGQPTKKNVKCPSYVVQVVTERPATAQEIPLIRRFTQSRTMIDWGTGSLVDPDHVLTAKHNVEPNHNKIKVIMPNGDEVGASVVVRHPRVDLILLRLNKVRYEKPISLHPDIMRVREGQVVKAIGFPGGKRDETPNEYEGKAQAAIFSIPGLERYLFRYDGQASTGVSGSPVVVDGKLVGVQTYSYEGLGIYCVNTHVIREFLERIK